MGRDGGCQTLAWHPSFLLVRRPCESPFPPAASQSRWMMPTA
jgi:hypothetical protein